MRGGSRDEPRLGQREHPPRQTALCLLRMILSGQRLSTSLPCDFDHSSTETLESRKCRANARNHIGTATIQPTVCLYFGRLLSSHWIDDVVADVVPFTSCSSVVKLVIRY